MCNVSNAGGVSCGKAVVAMFLLINVAVFPWLTASAQSTTAEENESQTEANSPTLSPFEVKIDHGKFVIRRKGTSKWVDPLKVDDPVSVGQLDDGHTIYVVTKAVKAPKPIHVPDPDYPNDMRNKTRTGRVLLRTVVDEHGNTQMTKVYDSSGPSFTDAALGALRKWTFEPGRLNDKPVAVVVNVIMDFQLYP